MTNIKPNKICKLEEKLGVTLSETKQNDDWESRNVYSLNQNNEVICLNLSRNRIEEITWLDEFDKLQRLDLSSNQISEIKGLENLRQLKKLSLFDNQVIKISGLDNLSELRELYLDSNRITEIEGLEKLKKLEKLDLHINRITEIKGLDSLSNLKYLDLSRNEISEIKGLENLKQLHYLSLWNNLIKDIKGLKNNVELQFLYLSRNEIREIKGLETLNKVKRLHLSNNQISKIKCLENLVNLKELQVSYNKIVEEKELYKLADIHSLENLRIDNNPVCDKLKEDLILAGLGNHLLALRNYCSANNGDDMRTLILPTKVVFLGNHGTGKTSFLNYLKDNKVQSEEGSTHVLSVQQYNCENYNLFNNYNLPYAMIYDFGGQDYYHGLYQAFLTSDSINILFWCGDFEKNGKRKDSNGLYTRDFTRYYWLSQINFAGNKSNQSPIVIIQSHADSNDDKNKYQNTNLKDRNVVGEFYLSLKNIGDAEQPNLNQKALEHTKACILAEIDKKRVSKGKAEYYIEFLKSIFNYNEYKYVEVHEILQYYNRPEDSRVAKIEYLKSDLNQLALQGLVMYYQGNKELENVVWLNPVKTVQYIQSKILSSDVLINDNGRISKETFDGLCDDEKIKNMLLRAHVMFFDKAKKQYIIPSYLPTITNKEESVFFFNSTRTFMLRFENFIPFGYFNRIICHYECEHYWNDALVFVDGATRVCIKMNFVSLEVEVFINSPDYYVGKKILRALINLYWDKDNITEDIVDIPEDLYISLDGDFFANYSELYNAKVDSLTACGGNGKFPGINKDKAKEIYIRDYRHLIDNKHINKKKKIFISYSRKDDEYVKEFIEQLELLEGGDITHWSCKDIGIEKWDDKIQQELQSSDLIVCMLSVNFFRSKYIVEKELPKILDANKKILNVVVRKYPEFNLLTPLVENNVIDAPRINIIHKLSVWQRFPYGRVKNNVTGDIEEKIIPLEEYPNKKEAYIQIVNVIATALLG